MPGWKNAAGMRHLMRTFGTCVSIGPNGARRFTGRCVVVVTRTRWQLWRLHEFFNLGGFEAHPDRTQLGRIEHGFDWLGVWFTPHGTTNAPSALENHRARRMRLYEQARRQGLSVTETEARVQT